MGLLKKLHQIDVERNKFQEKVENRKTFKEIHAETKAKQEAKRLDKANAKEIAKKALQTSPAYQAVKLGVKVSQRHAEHKQQTPQQITPVQKKTGFLDNYKQKQAERKAEKARLIAVEEENRQKAIAIAEARHQKLLSGVLTPIKVTTNLQPGETAYLELSATRMASVDSIVQETVGTTKKKHVVRRAVVGAALGGRAGEIVAGATAGGKQTSTTTQRTVTETKGIDSGQLILTDKRFLFIGHNNVVALHYGDIIATSFRSKEIYDRGNKLSDTQLEIKYPGMLNGEYYEVSGDQAEDTEFYYKGITNKLIK